MSRWRPGELRVVGTSPDLAALRAALREISGPMLREFDGIIRAAAKPMADDARARYRGFWQRRTGRTERSIKAGVRGGSVAVMMGGRGSEHVHGQEWGSESSPQFWRTGQPRLRGRWHSGEGLFFWPAVVEGRERIEADVLDAIDTAVDNAADRMRRGRPG